MENRNDFSGKKSHLRRLMKKPKKNSVYIHSPDVVSRSIEGEIIIVPITSGIGENPEDLFTLNETGREIWKLFDGRKTLDKVIADLKKGYDDPDRVMETDIMGLVEELLKRKLLIEKSDVVV